MTAAVSWLAGHGAVARRGTDGVHQVDSHGLTVALFRQHTSRTADPQLHTHALVWAKVQDLTGKWLALDAHLLKGQQRSIGWLYDAALRAELTARLGVAWGELDGGQADLVDVPEGLCEEFSKRSEQVEARLAEVLRRWVADHDGAEPDPRTLADLERDAVVKSRPRKLKVADAEALPADWQRQALVAGYRLPVVPTGRRSLPGLAGLDREPVLDEALRRVAQQDSSWLQADLMREVSTLVPADAATSAEALVAATLLAVHGVGYETAAQLLITAGDNPERLAHERSYAALCGVSPVPASSGKTNRRYRLNRGGDRQANSALWRTSSAWPPTHRPRSTSNGAAAKACPPSRSSAASSATSLASSSRASEPSPTNTSPRARRLTQEAHHLGASTQRLLPEHGR